MIYLLSFYYESRACNNLLQTRTLVLTDSRDHSSSEFLEFFTTLAVRYELSRYFVTVRAARSFVISKIHIEPNCMWGKIMRNFLSLLIITQTRFLLLVFRFFIWVCLLLPHCGTADILLDL